MTKKELKAVLKMHGHRVLKISQVPSSNNLFITTFDGNFACEIYVNFDDGIANVQRLSSVCVLKCFYVDWFDKYFN